MGCNVWVVHIAWRLSWSSSVAPVLHAPVSSSPRELNQPLGLTRLALSLSVSLSLCGKYAQKCEGHNCQQSGTWLPCLSLLIKGSVFFQHLFDSDRHEGSCVGVLGREWIPIFLDMPGYPIISLFFFLLSNFMKFNFQTFNSSNWFDVRLFWLLTIFGGYLCFWMGKI